MITSLVVSDTCSEITTVYRKHTFLFESAEAALCVSVQGAKRGTINVERWLFTTGLCLTFSSEK